MRGSQIISSVLYYTAAIELLCAESSSKLACQNHSSGRYDHTSQKKDLTWLSTTHSKAYCLPTCALCSDLDFCAQPSTDGHPKCYYTTTSRQTPPRRSHRTEEEDEEEVDDAQIIIMIIFATYTYAD
ncbi:hypothetical protein DAPPUDRAFT_236223 [Daphnia pulex]|uniref:Uncharacterized protein n=1 Tax=Daphnia pulex TaxID=6669 RepID=E9G1J4_DAPPU|nr:hypothetical protein DAPPUDRAFT_236223 [Daphnia pulex]|eukprot:EFX86505.1 hypothetical protein DAPPUDRAFT_236223 [Daphnia pulex]